MAFVAVSGTVLAARFGYSRLLDDHRQNTAAAAAAADRIRRRGAPRRDASRATVVLLQNVPTTSSSSSQQQQVEPLSRPQQLQQTNHTTTAVDAEQFVQFVAEQRARLAQSAVRNEQHAQQLLHQELEDAVLHGADARVTAFCDWYLSYPTTYRLLGIATAAAARHAVRRRSSSDQDDSLSDAVARELQAHVARHYEATVLRPGQTDPRLHRALLRSLQRAHQLYLESLKDLDAAVADFVVRQQQQAGSSLAATAQQTAPIITPDQVVLELDWAAQRQKVQHVAVQYDKSPERTVALVTAGAAAGKVLQ